MEGPGGYQFVGRTVQMWNRYRQTTDFKESKQWLLRFFDQIRFYPVSADELLTLREDFVTGKFKLRIEDTVLSLSEYRRFIRDNDASIAAFKATQQAAFEAERERWRASGQLSMDQEIVHVSPIASDEALPVGSVAITSPVTGSVWQLSVAVGDQVVADQELLVVEAMKMEIPLVADEAGEVVEMRCAKGSSVVAGQIIVVVRSRAA
jgi:urea carboxylase